ncbi:MAG: leucine-rich repeat domain-containing protein [Anaerolineae bacterium]|nr:leucine-rich repeat domain-containing protein [Anaerolineae bacterium]
MKSQRFKVFMSLFTVVLLTVAGGVEMRPMITLAQEDVTPPGVISDLQAVPGPSVGTVTLSWTAPGDDGYVGTATEYDIRYNTEPLSTTPLGWLLNFPVEDGVPTPSPVGSYETMTVTGLTPGQMYYFALRSRDEEAVNYSEISNIVTVVAPYTGFTGCNSVSQIPVAECEALVALFNSTDGTSWAWAYNEGWPITDNPCTWTGVSCNAGYVTGLDLSSKELYGSIPSELGDLIHLQSLVLSHNLLNGSIPSELGKLTNLQTLALNNNRLNGSIPSELGKLTNLQELFLYGNHISGSIPSELSKLSNLHHLYLSGNQLNGSIPSELGKLTNLYGIGLDSNELSGSIPSELGDLPYLTYLSLSGNQLSGSIPSKLGKLSNLQHLYLSSNQLNGSIPSDLGGLANLQTLYLSYNQLNGPISSELGKLTNLQELLLSNNPLSGAIPTIFTNLTQLESLDFENTNLCVPPDAAFQSWLDSIPEVYSTGVTCDPTPPSDKPPLIFIPGIGGSKLELPHDSRWAELWPVGDYNALSLFESDSPSDFIFASNIIYEVGSEQIYRPMIDQLLRFGYQGVVGCDPTASETPSLFIFPYDWRKDNSKSAERLKDLVSCIEVRHPNQSVNILAHSMGGLVARRYIIDNPGEHHVDKLITIGSPWLGAPKAIYSLETGVFFDKWFVDLVTHSTIKYVVGSFSGAHQLLPSQAYFDLSTNWPMEEAGWDRDGDGATHEKYSYTNYIYEMNKFYGADRNDFFEFRPGEKTQEFHSRTKKGNHQDDWSKNDTTGVEYHHIYGIQHKPYTIGTFLLKGNIVACKSSNSCWGYIYYDINLVDGDETVPLASARREGNGKNYNASGATLYEVRSLSKAQDEWAKHGGMPNNWNVQRLVLNLLGTPLSELPANDSQKPIPLIPVDNLQEEAVQSPDHRITIFGGQSPIVTDDTGHSTSVISGTIALASDVPGVATYTLGDQVEMIILDSSGTYTVSFQTSDKPMTIKIETGSGDTTSQAVRYQDLTLPPNVKTEFRFTPSGVEDLKYDSNGDNVPDKSVSPTISVSGAQAGDVTPPSVVADIIRAQNRVVVALTAEDVESGVKQVKYSLDGTAFKTYTAPLSLDPGQTPELYVFADDNLANRSSLLTFDLNVPSQVHLPIILK